MKPTNSKQRIFLQQKDEFFFFFFVFNPFVPNAPFLYPVKTTEKGFLMFSGGRERVNCKQMG